MAQVRVSTPQGQAKAAQAQVEQVRQDTKNAQTQAAKLAAIIAELENLQVRLAGLEAEGKA